MIGTTNYVHDEVGNLISIRVLRGNYWLIGLFLLSGQHAFAANPEKPALIPLPTQCNPCQIQPGNFTLRYQVVDDMFTDTGLVHLRLNLGEQAFNITVSAVIPGRAIFPFYRMEFAHERATNLFGVLSSADEAHNPHYHYFRREYEYNEFNYMGFYSLLSYDGELDIYVSENWDGAQVTETT